MSRHITITITITITVKNKEYIYNLIIYKSKQIVIIISKRKGRKNEK